MDSVTHLVLGAACGELLLGRKLGNKAMLLGALANTIPDFDVCYKFFESDSIKNIVFHRSYTHSILAIILLPFLTASISKRISKQPITYQQWYLFWFVGMITHVFIDCTTTYGTKIFTPFSNYQVAFNNMSIIDPIYTIPFMLLIITALCLNRKNTWRRKVVKTGLLISTIYVGVLFIVKANVQDKFKTSLQTNGVLYLEINTTPTMLNSVLWSAIAYNDSTIYTAEYSYLKPQIPIQWIAYKRNLNIIKAFDSEAIQSLVWFSDGNYFVESNSNDSLRFYNIKWGRARFDVTNAREAFIFHELFYRKNGEVKHEEVMQEWKFSEAFKALMNRIGI